MEPIFCSSEKMECRLNENVETQWRAKIVYVIRKDMSISKKKKKKRYSIGSLQLMNKSHNILTWKHSNGWKITYQSWGKKEIKVHWGTFCSQKGTAKMRIPPNCYLFSYFIIKSCNLSSDKIILWDFCHFFMTSKLGTQCSQEENL